MALELLDPGAALPVNYEVAGGGEALAADVADVILGFLPVAHHRQGRIPAIPSHSRQNVPNVGRLQKNIKSWYSRILGFDVRTNLLICYQCPKNLIDIKNFIDYSLPLIRWFSL